MQSNPSDIRPETRPWPVIVVGAGAAGLLSAIFAARGGISVLVLETRRQPGAKIRVSGGGRCNILPSAVELTDYHTSGSTKTLRNILFSWPLADVHRFFTDELGIPLKIEDTGKVFPVSDRSKDVVDALLAELRRVAATLLGDQKVTSIRSVVSPDGTPLFRLDTVDATFFCHRLVMATGGLSLPKTGSDGGGWRLAKTFGHQVLPTYPALVPLCTDDRALCELAGVSLPVTLTARRDGRELARYAGDFLFTHAGFSGPAALNISRQVAMPGTDAVTIHARWGSPELPSWDGLLRAGSQGLVATVVRDHLPRRLADVLLERAGVPATRRLSELSRNERTALVAVLEDFPLSITSNEGYRTAEITGGGIPLDEVHTKTLESRMTPGLYIAGEMLDVTGRLGGYNFLWAWVTGRRIGLALACETNGPLDGSPAPRA